MLAFKQFLKLSPEEKAKHYPELSEKDRFLARMNDWQPGSSITIKEAAEKDKKKHEKFMRQIHEAIEHGTLNLLEDEKIR